MADNDILTDDVLAKEALMIVENNLGITKLIKRRYEGRFAREGGKIGDHIGIRKPVQWSGREGEVMEPEGAQERSVTLKIDRLIGQDLSFSNVDLTLKIDMFRERYLDTACARIANMIDQAVCRQYVNIPNYTGTPGTTPTSLDSFFDASVLMSNFGVPGRGRSMVVSPRVEASIVNALKGLFQSATALSKQYETAMLGHVIGFDWIMDQNISLHTVGLLGGTPLVTTASQSGSTINTNGWTATTGKVKQGDIVGFSATDAVNPMSKDDTGALRGFVVTSDTLADGSGNMTIPIFPTMEFSGPYQNVSALPAANAPVTIFGSASAYASVATKQNLAIHTECMTAAFVDLDLPKGMAMAARAKSNKLGLAIRIVKGFDIRTNQELCRLDVLFGLKVLYEDFGCRVQSAQ